MDLDPLTISRTSVQIYKQFNQILTDCATNHHQHCRCQVLRRHYGERIFECGITGCLFHRHGFKPSSVRKSHMKHHDRPWKCSVEDCEFAEGGFLSRKMRDDHLNKYYTTNATRTEVHQNPPDPDEVQPLLFDLVQADETDRVRELLPYFQKLDWEFQNAMLEIAAYSGSPTMIDVLISAQLCWQPGTLAKKAIEGLNVDTLKHLLDMAEHVRILEHMHLLTPLVASGSEPLLEVWKLYFNPKVVTQRSCHVHDELNFLDTIKVTKGDPNKESFLISFWERARADVIFTKRALGMGLSFVAQTTCSVRLAKYLIDLGADVNFAPKGHAVTPVWHAARRDSAAAADLIRYLLLNGADPDLTPTKPSMAYPKIQDEKGPRGIAKWLGMSWDELLVKSKEEREKGLRDGSMRAWPSTTPPEREVVKRDGMGTRSTERL